MKSEKVFDAIVWLAIAAVGLVSAYVLFGVLASEASGKYEGYSVGGAIAGAIISWSVLTSVYMQLRGSSNELRELRQRAEELQHKLIRGAPRPLGFETEVDEKQRIVLARPRHWQPKGGLILDMEVPFEQMRSDDDFSQAFRCWYFPIEKGTPAREDYYEQELEGMRNADDAVLSSSYELIRVGGEQASIESLKVSVRQFVRTEIERDKVTGHMKRNSLVITRAEATGYLNYAEPDRIRVGSTSVKVRVSGYIHKFAQMMVDGTPRPTEILNDGEALVTLSEDDVAYRRFLRLSMQHPEAGKHTSNELVIAVEAEDYDEEPVDEMAVAVMPEPLTIPAPIATPAPEVAPAGDEKRVLIQEVGRQRVVCYHEGLGRIYFFEFWDDIKDFKASSAIFNQVLASVRFLD